MTARPLGIGYIGVGLMGLPMVQRLASLGYAVTAYDTVPDKAHAAQNAGTRRAASPAEAARGADVVVLNLPTPEAVEAAVFSHDGVASAMHRSQLLVDFSTIPVETCKRLAARLAGIAQCGWIDAPVSGGPPASAAGTLTVMAGGAADDIARVRPLMADVAARFTHMGPTGSGLAAKMINQLLVGCTFAMLAESVVLAEESGIDATRIPECLAGGYADSAMLQRQYPRMVARDFAPQGYARQMLKDLEMVNELAAGVKSPLPMMATALSLYRMLVHRGYAEIDTAGVMKLYEPDPSR